MSKSPDSSEHQHHHGPHDWHSQEYVAKWAEGQDQKEVNRQEAFRVMAETISYDKKAPIRILDVGAGYGALAQFLLKHFPNATAVCQDGSEEMTKLGLERMGNLNGRFSYVFSDFRKPGWSRAIKGPFEAVVSSIAIHNVREAGIIRAIYGELFPLVKAGGCFLNFEILTHPLENHIEWLREAGFQDMQCFWKGEERRALFGGYRK
jgi:ubiquinone/menaquinone biosynthesis C-methylase UbiE